MTRPLAFVMLVGLASLTGCPDNQYDYKTWTKKLDDPGQAERAVTELEQLGNPGAIPALGDAWRSQGKPVRLLQVIIGLARPLTPEEAKMIGYDNTEEIWKHGVPIRNIRRTSRSGTTPGAA